MLLTSQPAPPIPLALSESAAQRVEIGESVAALMEHPGWEHLKAGASAYQRVLIGSLMAISGAIEAAKYASLTGEMKGVAAIESIASGLVEAGEQAKTQAREAEIKEES